MLGSGTVGEAVQDLIFRGELKQRLGVELEIARIYTRDPESKKWYGTHAGLFTKRAEEVTDDGEIDLIVEVLGSQSEGDLATFKDYVLRALRQGKSVVTSDKALLAQFGDEIWKAAAQYRRSIRFEACVGGGIPIIRSLSQGLAAEEPEAIFGILNGTCNYILSEMKREKKSFGDILEEAQRLGFAETNPEADISGKDTEAKLILLIAVTFGTVLRPGHILRKGIEGIHPIDFRYAERKGSGTIKHLAVAREKGGTIQSFVSPVLVPSDHFLGTIEGVTNGIFFKGKRSETNAAGSGDGDGKDWSYVFAGPGAGSGATAMAVLGDVYELAQSTAREEMGVGPRLAQPLPIQREDQIDAPFYVRFVVEDRSGIVGEICQIFGDEGINISEIWQLDHRPEEIESLTEGNSTARKLLPFVITLEGTTVTRLKKALGIIAQKEFIATRPLWLPIWRSPQSCTAG